jgi:hypothetical protein
MWLVRLGVVLVAAALTGCGAYTAPPVQVVGAQSDLQSLAGEWHGTFRNTELRREGKIDFKMSAAADSAFGEVTMYTDRPNQPIWTRSGVNTSSSTESPPRWLRIRFVRIENEYLSGEMEPMFEPACDCYVFPKFLGRMRGSVIEGSFTSRSSDGRFETSGSWRVERVAGTAE